ncbi:MAG TPA: hypothetical protein VH208_11995 [Myxococcaceae bacterium]|nr:hypothetical protein [Myxococcaceae bacterium]
MARPVRPDSEPPRPAHERVISVVGKASLFLAYFRWLFMPLGLFALIAVGVHAAADTVDDRLLWLIDRADAAFDSVVSQWSFTQPMVNWVGVEQRIWLARSLALIWELAADLFLAIPALGYEEHDTRVAIHHRWRPILERVIRRPSLMSVVRPAATAAVVLAGSCAVGRMIQGALYLSLRAPIGDAVAWPISRVAALAGLGGVLVAMGGRAVLRNVQHAHLVADREKTRLLLHRWTRGLVGSAIVLPLAIAALVDATRIAAFFR